MSVKDIITEIEKLAQQEISAIEKQKAEEIEKIRETSERELEKKKERIHRLADQKAVEHGNGIVTRERLEMRNRLLTEKQSIVSDLFAKAGEHIRGLDRKDYLSFFTGVLKDSDIPKEEYTVVKAASDRHIDADFVRELSQNTGVSMKPGDDVLEDSDAGFIIRADYLELDFTLDTVLKAMRLDKEAKVVKVLWGQE